MRVLTSRCHCLSSLVYGLNAVEEYAGAPVAYGLDFGVTAACRALLVEANDGFALGCYGLDPVTDADMLGARWCELAGLE